MMNHFNNWVSLFVLCLMLLGCGGDEKESTPRPPQDHTKKQPLEAELVVESSGPNLFRNGEPVDAMAVVESIFAENDELLSPAFHAQFDRRFDREGQRLLWITMNNPFTPSQPKLDEAADKLFVSLKTQFDTRAQQMMADELAYQQSLTQAAAASVKKQQQALQAFQESQRGLPKTDASRLERRKLDRQIEVTLQAQIDADKLVKALQKKIDRKQHATLQRVR